jgi:hypothetical protein
MFCVASSVLAKHHADLTSVEQSRIKVGLEEQSVRTVDARRNPEAGYRDER